MAVLYWRAGRLTAKTGAFRPGQFLNPLLKRGATTPLQEEDLYDLDPSKTPATNAEAFEVKLGLGRIVALHNRSSTLYHIR
jgi:hypothetical protein